MKYVFMFMGVVVLALLVGPFLGLSFITFNDFLYILSSSFMLVTLVFFGDVDEKLKRLVKNSEY